MVSITITYNDTNNIVAYNIACLTILCVKDLRFSRMWMKYFLIQWIFLCRKNLPPSFHSWWEILLWIPWENVHKTGISLTQALTLKASNHMKLNGIINRSRYYRFIPRISYKWVSPAAIHFICHFLSDGIYIVNGRRWHYQHFNTILHICDILDIISNSWMDVIIINVSRSILILSAMQKNKWSGINYNLRNLLLKFYLLLEFMFSNSFYGEHQRNDSTIEGIAVILWGTKLCAR